MIKFKVHNKGSITQGFADNANASYEEDGLAGHTGVDYTNGWRSRVSVDNDCVVYKTLDKDRGTTGTSGFTGVYTLVHVKDEMYMEILFGHLNDIFVKEGESVPAGYVIGLEGNEGTVFSGGVRYDNGNPLKGKNGHHVHEQWRLVKRVAKNLSCPFYLLNADGRRYRDSHGYEYAVCYPNNNLRGCVNPMEYKDDEDTPKEKITMLTRLTNFIVHRFAFLRKL